MREGKGKRKGRRKEVREGKEKGKGQVHECTGMMFISPFNSTLATMAAGLPTVWAMAVKLLGVPYIVKLMCLVSLASATPL